MCGRKQARLNEMDFVQAEFQLIALFVVGMNLKRTSSVSSWQLFEWGRRNEVGLA